MDDPIQDIEHVVRELTQSPPKEQAAAIDKYFSRNASFTHPFCRTGNFDNSRTLIHYIFRWYKVMSPKIELKVNGVAYDEHNLKLYVDISQVFSIWLIPTHRADVNLTTVLQLARDEKNNPSDKKYYIISQNDLYQTNEFIKFVFPWGGAHLVLLWHFFATFFCVIGALLFTPFTQMQQVLADRRNANSSGDSQQALTNGTRRVENGNRQVAEKAKTNGASLKEQVDAKLKS